MDASTSETEYRIVGRVVDRAQHPLACVEVEAYDMQSGQPGSRLGRTMTDERGQFEIVFCHGDAMGREAGRPAPYLVGWLEDELLFQAPCR